MKSNLCGPMPYLLEAKEAAALLDVSTITLENWRSRGVGPAFFESQGLVRYHLSSVVKIALSRATGGNFIDPFFGDLGGNVCRNCPKQNSPACRIALRGELDAVISANNSLGFESVGLVVGMQYSGAVPR